jgi:hypothetical protein
MNEYNKTKAQITQGVSYMSSCATSIYKCGRISVSFLKVHKYFVHRIYGLLVRMVISAMTSSWLPENEDLFNCRVSLYVTRSRLLEHKIREVSLPKLNVIVVSRMR